MNFNLLDYEPFAADWTLESIHEVTKAREIIVGASGYTFKGDPEFRKRFLARLRKEIAQEQEKAATDEGAAQRLAENQASEKLLLESLARDPDDDSFDPHQVRFRQEKRAQQKGGEDLDGAHRDMIRLLQPTDNPFAPFTLKLRGDHILALVELIDVWIEENKEKDKATGAGEETDSAERSGDAAPTGITVEAAFLGKLIKLHSSLTQVAETVRAKRLVKTKSKSRAMTH